MFIFQLLQKEKIESDLFIEVHQRLGEGGS